MMKPSLLVFLLLVLRMPCGAESLFPVTPIAAPGSGAGLSLYADSTAHQVGDILTVIINENASANSQAATKTNKSENFSVTPGTGPNIIHIGPLHLGLGSIPALGVGDSTTSNAVGSTTRSDTLTGVITVVVKKILPGGSFLVEGTRQVGMNAETESITLTGIVRPQDVTAANTVQSSQIADAQIHYGGKGPVGEKQHDGLITRVFKFLF